MSPLTSKNSFIYPDPEDSSKVIIDGALVKKSKEESKEKGYIQLRVARTEESGFNWDTGKIKEVSIINSVVIHDSIDITCLTWFILKGIKINFSESRASVTPAASSELSTTLDGLSKKFSVVKGSTITIPIEGGYSGMGRTMALEIACTGVGFKVTKG